MDYFTLMNAINSRYRKIKDDSYLCRRIEIIFHPKKNTSMYIGNDGPIEFNSPLDLACYIFNEKIQDELGGDYVGL